MNFERPDLKGEGDKMEKPEESPQEAFEKKLEETKDYGVAHGMVEDKLKEFEEAEKRGEPVDLKWREDLQKKRDELRESTLREVA